MHGYASVLARQLDSATLAHGDKKRLAERMLEADPGLKTKAVAEIIGCSHGTVSHARKALGASARRVTMLERCKLLLTENPRADLESVAEAVGCCYGTAYNAAEALGVNADHRYSSALGNHQRWHVKRGVRNPDCPLCRAEDPSLGTPGGVSEGSPTGQPGVQEPSAAAA